MIGDDDNGILAKIPPEFVTRALDRLPDMHATEVGTFADAIVDVLDLGAVRITAVLKRNPRWKQFRFWTPVRADLA